MHLGRNLSYTTTSTSYAPFSGKTRLSTLIIGNDVTTIGAYLFNGCTDLTQITSHPTTPPTIQSNTFTGVNKSIPVYINCNYQTAYQSAQYWKDFTNYQCISSGIEEIDVQKFQIYPNPARDEIFIQSESPIKKIEIYSLTGILLLTENHFSGKISLANLPQGIYTLVIYTEKGRVVEKVIREDNI